MDKYKEQLGKMINLVEKQIRWIKVLSDFSLTDTDLKPQIDMLNEAKEVFSNESD